MATAGDPVIYASLVVLYLCLMVAGLMLAGGWNERRMRAAWRWSLTSRGRRVLEGASSQAQARADLARIALAHHDRLGLARVRATVEGLCDHIRQLLAVLVLEVRIRSAIAPLPPLRPRRFSVARLRCLAIAARVIHPVLISVAERHFLRLKTLWWMGRLAPGVVAALFRRHRWRNVGPADLSADLSTLTEESLLSLEAVLLAYGAEGKPERALEQDLGAVRSTSS